MSLQWTEDLAVGQPQIDSQHREMFQRFDAFMEACSKRHGLEHLRELFAFLDRYVAEHFQAEEALMEDQGYADLEAHRQQHVHFRRRLADLRDELDAAGPTVHVLVHTNKVLLFWLTEHIKAEDRRFGEHLRRKAGSVRANLSESG
ncbi:bacteriohemerythrin [Desulfuromonas sp.]|uniref:bacteriohemerythrin n=1 Tax=Desulfuromonas sp. TaxID=892 RepID=UPI0025C6DFD2|nr:bacteriohemerythrin [Desulfuromonas sp.]